MKKTSKWIRNIIISTIYVLKIEVDKSLFYSHIHIYIYSWIYISLISNSDDDGNINRRNNNIQNYYYQVHEIKKKNLM